MSEAAGDDEIWSTSADKVCSNEDLLSKILAGLDLSSLRLSKSVCKRWLSLITDPCFSRSPNADHPCGLFLQLRTGFSEFAYVPLTNRGPSPPLVTSFPMTKTTTTEYIYVLQSCNGLLLCRDSPDKLYVYNPTINYCKLLPLPHTWKANRFLRHMAIGFDPRVSPHYKVLYLLDEEDLSDSVQLEIYSSETGKWRVYPHKIFSLDSFLTFGFPKVVVYWHDAIHWTDRRQVYHFSLDTENPHFIQVENHIGATTYLAADKLLVSSSCDCLLLVKTTESCFQMNVYELKNSDYSSGWSLKYQVHLLQRPPTNFTLLPGRFRVLSIGLGEDPFLLLVLPGVKVLRYNIISNTFCELCDLTQIGHLDTSSSSFFFTPCLVGVN